MKVIEFSIILCSQDQMLNLDSVGKKGMAELPCAWGNLRVWQWRWQRFKPSQIFHHADWYIVIDILEAHVTLKFTVSSRISLSLKQTSKKLKLFMYLWLFMCTSPSLPASIPESTVFFFQNQQKWYAPTWGVRQLFTAAFALIHWMNKCCF